MKSHREIQEMKQHNLKMPSLSESVREEMALEVIERPKIQCPACKKSFVGIKTHLNKSKCKAELEQEEIEKIVKEATERSRDQQIESATERKVKSRERKKKEDHEAQKIKERLMKAYKRF